MHACWSRFCLIKVYMHTPFFLCFLQRTGLPERDVLDRIPFVEKTCLPLFFLWKFLSWITRPAYTKKFATLNSFGPYREIGCLGFNKSCRIHVKKLTVLREHSRNRVPVDESCQYRGARSNRISLPGCPGVITSKQQLYRDAKTSAGSISRLTVLTNLFFDGMHKECTVIVSRFFFL